MTQTGHIEDEIIDLMRDYNIPLTRENYLLLKYGGEPPEWSPELEEEVPTNLQDWKNRTFESSKGTGNSHEQHAEHSRHPSKKKQDSRSRGFPDLEKAENWT